MGVTEEQAKQWLGDAADEEEFFEVHLENKAVLEFFLAVSKQWRVASSMTGGIRYGLDYGAFREVRLALRIRQADWPGIFHGIQLMETAALEIFNEQLK